MKTLPHLLVLHMALLAGCAEKAPPVSVSELMEKPRLLEATMVRCSADRSLRYEAECVNARDASRRLQVAAENARREQLEQQSEIRRQALREAQEAADAAHRRALEEQKLREEAEYDGQFEAAGDAAPPAPGPDVAGEAPQPPESR